MARLKRIVVPGLPHHITQRGVRRSDIFLDPEDREVYGRLLVASCQQYSMSIQAYRWMTNHVHLVASPTYETSLAFVMRDTSGLYAVYFNSKYGFSGHLWQARFYSCLLDEEHFWSAIRYVERNPVRARMVGQAEDYRWSSARAHCFSEADPLLAPLQAAPVLSDWREWLADEEEAVLLNLIRRHTGTGRPLGSQSFLEDLEGRLGRALIPRRPGRKPRLRAPGHD